ENIARETGDTVRARVRDLALGAPAQVLHFGQRAQQPVLQIRGFPGERRDRIRRGFGRRGGFRRLSLNASGAGGRIRHPNSVRSVEMSQGISALRRQKSSLRGQLPSTLLTTLAV